MRREVQELFTVQCRSKVSASEEGGTGTVFTVQCRLKVSASEEGGTGTVHSSV